MSDSSQRTADARAGLQGLLVLDAAVRLFIWSATLAAALLVCARAGLSPGWPAGDVTFGAAWFWGQRCALFIAVYNIAYVLILVLLRLPIPSPREGTYEVVPGKVPDRQMLYAALISTLTKARYHAPFPAFLVFHAANLPPMSWLMNAVFGPRSRSCYVTDPCILDPYLVEIGRNVVIGFNTVIAGHFQEQDKVTCKKTIIEDDVLIGANVAMSGVHVKRGAVIAAGSIVLPGTVIGEFEYWSGNPARKRRDLRAAAGQPAADLNEASA